MENCSQCGSSVPNGQSICSMCIGDINHGSDGHYENWAREQEAKEQAEMDALQDQAEFEAMQNAQAQQIFLTSTL